jgi:hypothetical protein
MKLQHTFPKPGEYLRDTASWGFEDEVSERHHKVAEIIDRHLTAMRQEILRLDPKTMNIDGAGDEAEIARQVLTALVDQLRGFANNARLEIAEEERYLFGDDAAA